VAATAEDSSEAMVLMPVGLECLTVHRCKMVRGEWFGRHVEY